MDNSKNENDSMVQPENIQPESPQPENTQSGNVTVEDAQSEGTQIENVQGEGVQGEDTQGEDAASVDETQTTEKKSFLQNAVSFVKSDKFRKNASVLIPLLILLSVCGVVIYYIFWTSQGEFHADCTDTIMWANASRESGKMFDESFQYACLLPFGINLIMQPLISVFGLSLTTHHIGMMAFFLLLVGSMFLMLREMRKRLPKICLIISVFLSITLSTSKMREIFWQHTIYYTLGLLFIFIGLFLYFHMVNLGKRSRKAHYQDKKLKVRYWITFAVLCIFVMLCSTNGISGLSIFGLPFLVGIAAERIMDVKSDILGRSSIKVYIKLVVFAVMVIAGLKLLAFLQGDFRAGYEDAYSGFSSKDSWMDNGRALIMAWLTMFGAVNLEGTKLTDPDGIVNLLSILTAVVFAVIPVIATCFYKKYRKSYMRIFIWLHWAVSGIIAMGFIFGLLSAAEWRVVPAVSTAVMLSLMFISQSFSLGEGIKRFSVILCVPIVIFGIMNINTVCKMPADNYKDNVLFGLSQCLEENDLNYGYATFWNANSITVISGDKVRVRDVNVDENGVSKRWYQSSEKWYEDQPDVDKYFLLLNEYEYGIARSKAENNVLDFAEKQIDPVVNGQPFHIFVFNYNFV